jgi:hypothetical protein
MNAIALRALLPVLIATALLPACGRAPAPQRPGPAAGDCRVSALSAESERDTVRVALMRPFRLERLRRPADEAERTLVGNVYETLVRVDCHGAAVPGLAARWQADPTGARWTFALRPAARFTDGRPVTARDVAASWSNGVGPRSIDGRSARALIRSVEAVDEATLVVTLLRPAPATVFADPSLAVLGDPGSGGWPAGTGPYASAAPVGEGRGGYALVRLERVEPPAADAGAAPGPAVLEFSVPPGGDLRNALDLGFDVVVTRDPGTLAYARAISDVTTTPLPWDRTYVLLAPAATGVEEAPPAEALRDLAGDAIRTEARPALELAADAGHCPAPAPPGGSARVGLAGDTAPRVLYPARDEAARGLAERIAAVAGPPASAPWVAHRLPLEHPAVAAAVDSAAFERALRAGRAAAYVVRMAADEPCPRATLAARAPWLAGAAGAALTPLADTRARAIVRSGIGAVYVDGAGGLRFDPVLQPAGR